MFGHQSSASRAAAVPNPFRSPRWRYDRVLQLVRGKDRRRRTDDYPVLLLHRYLSWSAKYRHDREKLAELAVEYPEAVQVHSLYFSGPVELRQILEARLLTTESFEEIEANTCIPAAVAEFYEKLYFNVRDRLQAKGWIHTMILRYPNRRAALGRREVLSDEERGFLYRWFAYHGGPIALDMLIAGIGVTGAPTGASDVTQWLDSSLLDLVRTRATAAAHMLDINPRNAIRLIKLASPKKGKGKPADVAIEQDEFKRRFAETLERMSRIADGDVSVDLYA